MGLDSSTDHLWSPDMQAMVSSRGSRIDMLSCAAHPEWLPVATRPKSASISACNELGTLFFYGELRWSRPRHWDVPYISCHPNGTLHIERVGIHPSWYCLQIKSQHKATGSSTSCKACTRTTGSWSLPSWSTRLWHHSSHPSTRCALSVAWTQPPQATLNAMVWTEDWATMTLSLLSHSEKLT